LDLNEAAPQWNLPKDVGIAYPDFVAWRAQNRSFASIAVFTSSSANLSGFGPAVRVDGAQVSYDLAATLGIKPVLGRDFLPEEDHKGAPKVALLSYGLWQRKFAGSPNVTAQILRLDNEPYTIVGVLPKTAVFPDKAEVWTLLQLDPNDQNTGWFLDGVGRLNIHRPGRGHTRRKFHPRPPRSLSRPDACPPFRVAGPPIRNRDRQGVGPRPELSTRPLAHGFFPTAVPPALALTAAHFAISVV
jgi:hypothetical protein